MHPTYVAIRNHARLIASRFPPPLFYTVFSQEHLFSRRILSSDSLIDRLQREMAERLNNNLGHGLKHAEIVAVDVGTLMTVEGKRVGYSEESVRRHITIVQCAALLHDVNRSQKDHARKGAETAREILKKFPLTPEEVDNICRAIENHEAFKPAASIPGPSGALISNCLYDADKFRWGPDNFTDTVWHMVSFARTPVPEFIKGYPGALEGLTRIKSTFRTDTGKEYGPQIIDLGLEIGRALQGVIQSDFSK